MSTEPPAWQPPPPPAAGYPSAGYPPAGYAPAGYGAPAQKRPVRTWDIVVTVILLVLLGVLAFFMSFFGFFLAMASDPCGAVGCNTDLIATGMLTAVVLPWVFLLLAVVGAIVLLVLRRLAFWVPIAASPFLVGSWFLGAAIASAGVPTG
ncbi:DUF6264 family protein [Microbacterium sp. DT81.1]|uniref:DUF6264 family protein n=1 Tax=Microbacterium sp. DT81.1 TaxID=3393413 RepID=UPI003CEDD4DE